MLFNLLAAGLGGAGLWIGLGVLLVFMLVMNAISNKKRREQMEAERQRRGAIEPGFKVTTIGGIMGEVVEVNHEANTFVLKTGTEENPCYIKFDKVAIYTSENPNAPVEEIEEEPVLEDVPTEEVVAEEVVAEEVSKEEKEAPITEDAE